MQFYNAPLSILALAFLLLPTQLHAQEVFDSSASNSAGHLQIPTGDVTCEDDVQWLEIKRKLFFLLQRLAGSKRIDPSWGINLLASGVSPGDLLRCPFGALAVKLFFQLALSLDDPGASLQALSTGGTGETPEDQIWHDLSLVSWPLLLASRWPVFESLSALRDLLLPRAALLGACSKLGAEHMSANDPSGVASLDTSLLADCPAGLATVDLAKVQLSSSCEACELSAPELALLEHAQLEATPRWPADLLRSPWPALPLLAATERRASPAEWRQGIAGELRGAIAYIHFRPGEMPRFHDIEKSLSSLEKYWLSTVSDNWPIIIFVDAKSATEQAAVLRGRFPRLDLRVAVIDERDLMWPIRHDHPFCSPGYRRAARFTAGPLYMHKALDGYTHLLLLDTEFVLTHPVPWDPLRNLFEQGGQLGYWQTHYEKTWNRTLYLTEVSREFMRQRNLTPQVPELVRYWWDFDEETGGSLPVNVYGCLFAGAMSFFRSQLFQSYFQELDSWPGFDEHCWSPQSILAIAAAFFLNDNVISELWVFGRHQNSSKTPDEGWNLSMKGRLPTAKAKDLP